VSKAPCSRKQQQQQWSGLTGNWTLNLQVDALTTASQTHTQHTHIHTCTHAHYIFSNCITTVYCNTFPHLHRYTFECPTIWRIKGEVTSPSEGGKRCHHQTVTWGSIHCSIWETSGAKWILWSSIIISSKCISRELFEMHIPSLIGEEFFNSP